MDELNEKIEQAFREIITKAWTDYHPPQQYSLDQHIFMALQTLRKNGLILVEEEQ